MDTADYVKPADVAVAMAETGKRKLALAPSDLLIRGMLSGAILGVATSLAITGAVQTNVPLVGALIFPTTAGVGKDWQAARTSPGVAAATT